MFAYNLPSHKSGEDLGFDYWGGKLVTKVVINTTLIYRVRWEELIKSDMARYQLSVLRLKFSHMYSNHINESH